MVVSWLPERGLSRPGTGGAVESSMGACARRPTPESTSRIPAGELDRILDFAPSTNAALERQLLFNKIPDQAPTVVHELHNVTLHAGAVWRHDVRIQRSDHSPRWLDFRPLVTSTLSHAMLSATATSAHALEPLLIERLAHCLGEPVLGDHAQAPGDSLPGGTAIDTLRSCLPWRVAPADGVRVRRLLSRRSQA
ncbi:MAG: hypothetical protein R3E84_14820 [Pseudomonadales bacterium]